MRLQSGFKDKIKYFVSESVRPRTVKEYSAVFLRGLKANENPLSDKTPRSRVPWLYLRVLAFGFILFAIVLTAFRLCYGATDFMSTIFYGALFFNVATLVFFYELYPESDLSLLLLLLTVLVGGAISNFIISLGYEFIYSDPFMSRPWISLIWTAFSEEFAKGAVAITAVVLLKNKNPFYCFLIGFAVGTGYSYLEDIGYIYNYAGGRHYEWAVLMSIGRGLSCAFSHAPWTGLICWAFAKFKKPFINFRFYAVVLACMVLHYFADIPFFAKGFEFLKGLNFGWLIEAAVVGSIIALQYFALRNPDKGERQTPIPVPQTSLTGGQKFNHAANVTALLCAVAVSAAALVGCALDIGEKYGYDELYGEESFIALVQAGSVIKADWEREYDETAENYIQIIKDGKQVRAVQKEVEEEREYYYYYETVESGEMVLTNIAAKVDGKVYYCEKLLIYEDYYMRLYGYPNRVDYIPDDPPEEPVEPIEPEEPVEPVEPEEPVEPPKLLKTVIYYPVDDFSYSYDIEKGCFLIRQTEPVFHGLTAVIVIPSLIGAISVGGVTATIVLKKKSRKAKND
ncbi:MAG: PrsW family intramembrane metalloprotease [Clostridia bacterium]|nr:PrsW family intramembrane metalloprotease [Clostridia bacterium]